MKYKCKRENKEICTVTTDIMYNIGDKIDIKLDNEVIETVSVLEIVK